ncbi:MAG: hypothetical protein CM15mP102_16710 [Flavobacteriales bacterium]|nr:MAG: hypothetical protein CM15mP102_16710 [Flavobacteriales bacterium]
MIHSKKDRHKSKSMNLHPGGKTRYHFGVSQDFLDLSQYDLDEDEEGGR